MDDGLDEGGGDLGDDGVSVGAQSSHAVGNPMSQREKAGFSWPEFAVAAGEPLEVEPRVVMIISER